MIKLKHSIPLALLSLAGASSPACADPKYDFALHGYIRSGILANSDGNRADSVGLMPDGKWRLGNEEDTKIELIPTVTLTSDSGVVAKVQANITHQSKCTSDWNCQDDDGHDVQFREGFAELSNLDFAPEMTFWAGKRYSSSNTSSHQFDWEYIQYNGTGGGFDNMDLGFARFDAGVYAFSPTDETKAYPVDKGDQGYPDDYSLNLWLKKIGGTGFDLDIVDLNCAKGIVGDADVGGRRDRAVRTNCDGEDGRDHNIHLRRSRIAVKRSVRGGRQADAGGAGAAGDIHGSGFGSGCANGETCHKADGEEQGYEFLHVLHSEFSFFVLLVLDGNMDDGPGNTKRCAGVRI